ncbi:WD40 repeat domain-containing protein [Modestobacter marinus]|uniref:WD40 repeat domain-containing protein n=1 Tax=Modestobacter marinus TaxID=477641 RepID=UPI0034D704AD
MWDVAFSPDGRQLASASADGTVLRWDLPARRPHGGPLTGATGEVYGVAFSRDGRFLAASIGDPAIRLCDSADGSSGARVLTGHSDQVLGVAISPDGRQLASASLTGRHACGTGSSTRG